MTLWPLAAPPTPRSLEAVLAVDVASGAVSRVTPANGASWSLVAMHGGGWRQGMRALLGLLGVGVPCALASSWGGQDARSVLSSCAACLPPARAAAGWVVASESRPSRPFALFAAHLPASEAEAPTAAAWGWSSLPLPDAEPEGWPAAVREALHGIDVTTLQVAPTTPPTNLAFEAVVLHR